MKNLWFRKKDIRESLGVQNIYDLVDKEIKGNARLKTLQNNKLESITGMDQK